MRLIDADALEYEFGVSDADIVAKEIIREAATVDAIPVVKCQNCEYYTYHDTNLWCKKLKMEVEPGFYCGLGEKDSWCDSMPEMIILGTKTDEERDFYRGIYEEKKYWEIVQNAPTIEIVKCSDCKYHQDNSPFHYCKKHGVYCPDDSEYFCAYGERKGVI